MKNLLQKIKTWLFRLYQRSYGIDDINKALLYVGFAFAIAGLIFRNNPVIRFIPLILFAIYFFRFFSTNKVARIEENRKFRKLSKYYSMKWQYRKTHKIFRCKTCGQLIRVPKGKGKIETTCPSCGAKENHKT